MRVEQRLLNLAGDLESAWFSSSLLLSTSKRKASSHTQSSQLGAILKVPCPQGHALEFQLEYFLIPQV